MNFTRSTRSLLLLVTVIVTTIGSTGCFEDREVQEPDADVLSLSEDSTEASAEPTPDIHSPGELCEELIRVSCKRLFECLTDYERSKKGVDVSEQRCVDTLLGRGACSTEQSAACPRGTFFDPWVAQRCVEAQNALTCSQARAGEDADSVSCTQYCKLVSKNEETSSNPRP